MGNFYMEFKPCVGRPLKYTPEQLLDKFAEYVCWCDQNPIVTRAELVYPNGNNGTNKEYKPRYLSIGGFLIFIGGYEEWWRQLDGLKRGKEFLRVKGIIKDYCTQYQLEMASAGLLKQNIISRLLGLTDKKEVQTTGEGVTIVVKSEDEKKKIENIGKLGM